MTELTSTNTLEHYVVLPLSISHVRSDACRPRSAGGRLRSRTLQRWWGSDRRLTEAFDPTRHRSRLVVLDLRMRRWRKTQISTQVRLQ